MVALTSHKTNSGKICRIDPLISNILTFLSFYFIFKAVILILFILFHISTPVLDDKKVLGTSLFFFLWTIPLIIVVVGAFFHLRALFSALKAKDATEDITTNDFPHLRTTILLIAIGLALDVLIIVSYVILALIFVFIWFF